MMGGWATDPYILPTMAGAGTAKNRGTLKSAIESRTFEPVYYLHGEDDYLKEDTLRRVIDAAVDPATRDFNLEVRRSAELDAETLGSLLDTPPMMADRRVVVLRDVTALKKDARAMLDRYLKAPAPDLVLLLVAPAGAKSDKSLESKSVPVDFQPLTGAQLPKWIEYYVERELKARITPEAVALLQDAVGSELAMLKLELDKLASFAGAAVIDDEAVGAVVGVRRTETLGAFLDAVGRRDAAAALALLPCVLQQPKTSGVSIVMALTTQTLAIAWGLSVRERGGRPDFFSLLKETGAYPGRAWGEAATAWSRMLQSWTLREMDAALDALLHADAALKDTRASSDEQLLSSLVLSLCARGRMAA